MNSRDRILAAFNHTEPDRVPIDFGGHRSSGIMAIAYNKLKKALNIESGDIYVYDIVQQLAIVEPEVLDILHIDVIEMGRGFLFNESDWKEWTLPDGTPCKIPYYINLEKHGEDWYLLNDQGMRIGVQKKGCLYFEQTYFPLAERGIQGDDFADLEEVLGSHLWAIPHPGAHLSLNSTNLTQMKNTVRAFRNSTDRAIIGLFGGNLFELPQCLYSMEKYLEYLILYPEKVVELSQKLCAIHLKNLEKWLAAVGESIDIIAFGDDFGGQSAPLISLDMYRHFYRPFQKKLFQHTKELADVKILFHSCGDVESFINDFINVGIDAVNPVQINCKNMHPGLLKQKYGDNICFWGGGCDTRDILTFGTLQEVTQNVKELVDIFKPHGGFVFQQVHNIMANVPPENIIAMFKAINPGM